MASQFQRFWFLLPLQSVHVESPQVPGCAGYIGGVGVEVLGGQGGHLRRASFERAQIPFRDRSLTRIDSLDDQFAKGVVRNRARRGGQETRELGDHRLERKVARDRKSTRLNSSHVSISYAVFCLKKKK